MIEEHDATWVLIKKHLTEGLNAALGNLTTMSNTHEQDIRFKAKIAVYNELLNLPQEISIFAANQARK